MPISWTNRFLFSHLYLEQLCQDGEHQAEAADLIADLRGWLPDWDDSSLSSLLSTQIEPTLVGLGFHYERLPDVDRVLRLYADYGRDTALGLCCVAHREDGEVDLDSTVKGRHYAAEIVHALKEEELSWGLLTDGKRWRLYHADELAPYETFLEIDLERLLRGEGGSSDAALLFHLLFRRPACELDENGECALDRHLQRSEETAEGIEEHLSDCIEEVLRDLCQGFVERDGKDTYTSDERDDVFRNATVLLYRVLFILYAEARDLLPLGDPAYDPHSLDALVEQAIDYARGSGLPDPDGTELWQDLSDLCSWINSGDDERKIPAYNGDLFDDSDKRYIHDHTVADKYLAPALFSLGCLEGGTEDGWRRIDYRDLSVRHLGSIYEGLLEYKLFIAQEKRVRRSDGKGGYTFPKLSETRLKKGEEDDVIEIGDVYFAHSAGERKALGAYYTPEYIVDYIVKQTMRRGLEERREALEEQLPSWLEEVEAAPPADRARLQRTVDQRLVDFVEQEALTFRVCDPAMGSGHFLVNAAHAITNFVVETLSLTPWENPDLDADPVTWRRKVAKRCLYGVDLNDLAVELAKLSLWLTTAARGKPLNFYDHHLRQGNSLIGVRLRDLAELLHKPSRKEKEAKETGQILMFEEYSSFRHSLIEATRQLHQISDRLADAAEDVKAQAADYEEIRQKLEPYRELADLLTTELLCDDIKADKLRAIAKWLLSKTNLPTFDEQTLLNQALKLSKERSFFQWEIEFPEVFLGSISNEITPGGFDAVIGNPPYIRQEGLGRDKDLLQRTYQVYNSTADLYVYFIERGLSLLLPNGKFGMITSNKFFRASYAAPLRQYLSTEVHLREIVDFALLPVFPGITVRTAVLIAENRKSNGHLTQYAPVRSLDFAQLDDEVSIVSKDLASGSLGTAGWSLASPKEDFILSKMEADSIPLRDFIDDQIRRGVITGYNKAFIIDDNTRAQLISENPDYIDLIKPLVVGRDIGRYEIEFADRYLIWAYEGVDIDQYPAVKSYLSEFRGHLEQRWDRGEHWYELRPCSYYEDFKKSKIVYPDIAMNCSFAYDESGLFVEATAFSICTDDLGLLAILNSSLSHFYFNARCTRLEDANRQAYLRFKTVYLEPFPVHCIEFTTPAAERERLATAGIAEITEWIENTERHSRNPDISCSSRIENWLDARLSAEPEQADVVHDLLAHLAEQMIEFHNQRQELEQQVDLFRYVDTGQPFVHLEDAFVFDESRRSDDMMDLEAVHHDIDGLRLLPNEDGTWTLELQAKFRDPEQGWREHVKEEDGRMIKRQWMPAYRLRMSEEKARFYRYALPRLQEFDNAGSFPGGYTRSTLKKLHLTKVPILPDVDLSELARLDRELRETKRKITLTDDLIDQIVYKLYGLTEEEIAIVEGRA